MSLNSQMCIRKTNLVIRLEGELDHKACDVLKQRVVDLSQKYKVVNVILNFKNVTFMDSSGIGFIIGRFTQVKMMNGKIIICSMNNYVERIYNISGLNKICQTAQNEYEAERILGVA